VGDVFIEVLGRFYLYLASGYLPVICLCPLVEKNDETNIGELRILHEYPLQATHVRGDYDSETEVSLDSLQEQLLGLDRLICIGLDLSVQLVQIIAFQ
jgi:hypothetical protein